MMTNDVNANTSPSSQSNAHRSISDVLSESTLECMRQQVIRQRVKVEAESRRHQHYHSQRSTRSQDVNFSMSTAALFNNNNNNSNNNNNNHKYNNNNINIQQHQHTNSNKAIRPNSSYYEYETVQHNVKSGLPHARMGSIKHNGHSPISQPHSRQTPSPVTQSRWKSATMNGFSPASINSSARSRGPYVTHVTIREQQQPVYQSVQQAHAAQSHSSKV